MINWKCKQCSREIVSVRVFLSSMWIHRDTGLQACQTVPLPKGIAAPFTEDVHKHKLRVMPSENWTHWGKILNFKCETCPQSYSVLASSFFGGRPPFSRYYHYCDEPAMCRHPGIHRTRK